MATGERWDLEQKLKIGLIQQKKGLCAHVQDEAVADVAVASAAVASSAVIALAVVCTVVQTCEVIPASELPSIHFLEE